MVNNFDLPRFKGASSTQSVKFEDPLMSTLELHNMSVDLKYL
jgi:hypothetical protein